MSRSPSQRHPGNDEFFDQVVERTLALDAMLHAMVGRGACAALVDVARTQRAAVSLILTGRRA